MNESMQSRAQLRWTYGSAVRTSMHDEGPHTLVHVMCTCGQDRPEQIENWKMNGGEQTEDGQTTDRSRLSRSREEKKPNRPPPSGSSCYVARSRDLHMYPNRYQVPRYGGISGIILLFCTVILYTGSPFYVTTVMHANVLGR